MSTVQRRKKYTVWLAPGQREQTEANYDVISVSVS